MSTNIFQEIDNLHSQWSAMEKMDKMTKLGWLMGERMRLNGLANQLALYVRDSGGFANDAEKAYARELLEMIQAVDVEGAKTVDELRNEAVKELAKYLIHC